MPRILLQVNGGIVDGTCDRGVEWNIIDWDDVRQGRDVWSSEEIDALAEWGAGLVPERVIADLRKALAREEESHA